jgi:hypothetical protein
LFKLENNLFWEFWFKKSASSNQIIPTREGGGDPKENTSRAKLQRFNKNKRDLILRCYIGQNLSMIDEGMTPRSSILVYLVPAKEEARSKDT